MSARPLRYRRVPIYRTPQRHYVSPIITPPFFSGFASQKGTKQPNFCSLLLADESAREKGGVRVIGTCRYRKVSNLRPPQWGGKLILS